MIDTETLLTVYDSENADRIAIIKQLEESKDERVVILFDSILQNRSEDDLVRIEILKGLFLRRDILESRVRFAGTIRSILSSEDEDLVRQFAAKAMRSYIDLDGAVDLLERLVKSENEDIAVRYSALAAIEANSSLASCQDALRRLIYIPELGRSAQRTLQKLI